MRKRYSIGILIVIIFVVFLFLFIYKISYKKAVLDMEAKLLEGYQTPEDGYYILESDGYVTVVMPDKKTVYEYTSIPVEDLPEEIQKELKDGKKMDSIGQVYGFLENYSS